MPLLTILIDVKIAVPLCILNSVLITSYLSLKLKGYIEKKTILPLFLGSLPGIYIGVNFLKNVEAVIIKLILGGLIVSYGLYSLLFHKRQRKAHHLWAYVAGFCTGFIGSAFSAGGPPTIIYTAHTGWPKDYIKVTLTGFFLIASVITALVHAASGLTKIVVLKYFIASAFFVLIGVYAGSLLYSRMSRQEYMRAILILLILLGVMMIVSALKG